MSEIEVEFENGIQREAAERLALEGWRVKLRDGSGPHNFDRGRYASSIVAKKGKRVAVIECIEGMAGDLDVALLSGMDVDYVLAALYVPQWSRRSIAARPAIRLVMADNWNQSAVQRAKQRRVTLMKSDELSRLPSAIANKKAGLLAELTAWVAFHLAPGTKYTSELMQKIVNCAPVLIPIREHTEDEPSKE